MKYIISLLLLTVFCWQPVVAQSDIELTDSTSTDWGDNIGGGFLPALPTDPVTSLTLSMTEITLDGGDRFRLTAQTNSTAANKAVTWSVEDNHIAMIYGNGTLVGVKKGTTIVIATSVSNPEVSATCEVTVTSDFVGMLLPDVSFEFFFKAADYNVATRSIPNHEEANLSAYSLKLSAAIPTKKGDCLIFSNRCEGYINRWEKESPESGDYFYRGKHDDMTIVCKVKPELDTGNASDFISNRGGGYNYMFRIGDNNTVFLHTGTAYEDERSLKLPYSDVPQILAVRVNGAEDYIQINNLTTGECHKVNGVNWGGDNIVENFCMKFFYNDGGEFWTGDFYWMYYSFEYITDEELKCFALAATYDVTVTASTGGSITGGGNYKSGSSVTLTAIPDNGYRFVKWSDDSIENPYTFAVKEDKNLAALFEPISYNVIYILDGVEYKQFPIPYGNQITIEPVPTKEGHTFSGWSEVPETMPLHDVIVTGTFTANSYMLTYVLDGEIFKTETVTYGTAISTPEVPAKEGHTFTGWANVPATMPAKDVTVTGTFTANSYKVTYILDGETFKTETVTYGTAIPTPEVPAKEGYNFSGWGEVPATMPAKDLTFTGSYTINKDLKYNLVYMVDGTEYKRVTIAFGDAIILETAPTKEGHTFSGWSEVPETMPLHDVTVTGTFTANSYTLTYVLDGETFKTESVVYGTAVTAPEAPAKEGYTFAGWMNVPAKMPAKDIEVTGHFEVDGIDAVLTDQLVDVYTLQGVMLKRQISVDELKYELSRGIYIINGKKVVVR